MLDIRKRFVCEVAGNARCHILVALYVRCGRGWVIITVVVVETSGVL
jgi:hypothetical protein